jgi:hypothetical protein
LAAGVKRITHRQWWHRLIHRKCWNCNVALEHVADLDGRRCPMCLTFYGETIMVAHERNIRARWWLSPWTRG